MKDVLQTVAAFAILGVLGWLGLMVTDGHDTLNRIDQALKDNMPRIQKTLDDHETRIRFLERP